MLHINTVGNYRSKHNFVQAMEEGNFIDMTATISSREKVLFKILVKSCSNTSSVTTTFREVFCTKNQYIPVPRREVHGPKNNTLIMHQFFLSTACSLTNLLTLRCSTTK